MVLKVERTPNAGSRQSRKEPSVDDLTTARRRWKNSQIAVRDAEARLQSARSTEKRGGEISSKVAEARKETEQAAEEERKAKRKYKKAKREKDSWLHIHSYPAAIH